MKKRTADGEFVHEESKAGLSLTKHELERVVSADDVAAAPDNVAAAPKLPPKDPLLGGRGRIPGACLLIIDPQNDFHDGGSLAVAGANEDSDRIAAFLAKHGDEISNVVVTLDSHQTQHIAHASFWEKGGAPDARPDPFTVISAGDIRAGAWRARDPALRDWTLEYATRLEASGRFQLRIWPEHCLVGTEGHALYPPLRDVVLAWARRRNASPTWLRKGENNVTEMYSCFGAEVPVDDATALNVPLVAALARHDKVLVCGQAKSHCVNHSVRDLLKAWPAGKAVSDVVLLNDATSSVAGFEKAGAEFERDMVAQGVTVTTTEEAL